MRHFHDGKSTASGWLHLGEAGIARGGASEQEAEAGPAPPEAAPAAVPGMLLHLDGSQRWFVDDRWYDLLVVLDDASSEIYYAQLVEQESTRTVLAALTGRAAGDLLRPL